MHLRILQTIFGFGRPRQPRPLGRESHSAPGVLFVQHDRRLVPQLRAPMAEVSGASLVSDQERTLLCRHADDLAPAELRCHNGDTTSRGVPTQNLAYSSHPASQPNRLNIHAPVPSAALTLKIHS